MTRGATEVHVDFLGTGAMAVSTIPGLLLALKNNNRRVITSSILRHHVERQIIIVLAVSHHRGRRTRPPTRGDVYHVVVLDGILLDHIGGLGRGKRVAAYAIDGNYRWRQC